MPLSTLLGAAFFFSLAFVFLMCSALVLVLVPLVGGRHTATNAICNTARGSRVPRSAGTGSATKSWNLYAYSESTRIGCICEYICAASVLIGSMGNAGALVAGAEGMPVVLAIVLYLRWRLWVLRSGRLEILSEPIV